jgi:Zn-dependent protease with chaperone function
MKVLFVLAYTLEALGVDFGIGRLLLTFLLQCVEKVSSLAAPFAHSHIMYRLLRHRLPNSRQSESEADRIGIRLMS